MAYAPNNYTGNGSTVLFPFSFPYIDRAHVKVKVNGVLTTAFTFDNDTTIRLNTAPSAGVPIEIFRETPADAAEATIFAGSAIRASDLNANTTQLLYVAEETGVGTDQANNTANAAAGAAANAVSSAAAATSTANNALSTANTASSNATAAVGTANTANNTASTALSNANAAVNTANSASSAATAATNTANAASSTANTALNTANNAASAVAGAVSTANAASSAATTAIDTANAASSTANNALSVANAASATATQAAIDADDALTESGVARATADAAIAAVASAVAYQPVADLTALGALTPADGDFYELTDSTGAESDPSITGVPIGLTGSSVLTFRLRYDDPPGEFAFIGYFANDPENQYAVKATEGVAASAQADADQALLDAAAAQGDATQALSDAAAAQSTANAALPKAGGTMTGNISFAGTQTFPVGGIQDATIAQKGVVQLTDSVASTSTTTAATPNSVKTANDNASNAVSTANAAQALAAGALQTAGGTMTGPLQLPFGDKSSPSLTWGITGTGFFRPQPGFGVLGLAVNSIVRRLWNFDGDEAHNSETFSTATDYRVIKYNGPIGTILRFFSNETLVSEIWNDTTTLRIGSLLGAIRLLTAGTDRLRINSDGGWGIGANGTSFGQAGQVFTTNGSNSPPTWTDKISVTEFTTNTLWTKPTTGRIVKVKLWGAGGSGGRRGSAGGGGGGAYIEKEFLLSNLPATVQITIGIGGASRSTDGDGFDGTATTFGSLLSAAGGKGGVASNNFSFGGRGADSFNISGGTAGGAGGSGSNPGREGFWGGGGGGGGDTAAATPGGSSVYGGGGGAGRNDNNVRAGGASLNGGFGAASNTGATGGFPGGGGGASNSTSGAGANGKCVIEVI